MTNILNCSGHELKIPNIVDSKGIYLFDGNGKRYMDLESGVWCMALGHKNERVNNAIKKQIDLIMHAGFCYSSAILEEAAESVLSVTGLSNGQCVFLSSGSESIEIIRQISRCIANRQKTLVLHDAYLGSYDSVINRDSNQWVSFDWQDCEKCPKNANCDSNCKMLQAIPNDISEFIFEPGSASGFVRFPPKALIQKMVEIVRKNNGKIIVNEVTTGVGRTGKWFAYQHYDIAPDMIALGKGVGNGYPVSVAALSNNIIEELKSASDFSYMQGHQNDPLGAAVVKEVIQVISDEDLINAVAKKGELFFSQLSSLVDEKIVMGIRGRGLMFAVEIISRGIVDVIYTELIECGYIVCNRGSFLRIDPPLIITENQFSEFIDDFSNIIAKYYNN